MRLYILQYFSEYFKNIYGTVLYHTSPVVMLHRDLLSGVYCKKYFLINAVRLLEHCSFQRHDDRLISSKFLLERCLLNKSQFGEVASSKCVWTWYLEYSIWWSSKLLGEDFQILSCYYTRIPVRMYIFTIFFWMLQELIQILHNVSSASYDVAQLSLVSYDVASSSSYWKNYLLISAWRSLLLIFIFFSI